MPCGISYPSEIRNRTVERVKNGECKLEVSLDTGISYTTVRVWTRHLQSPMKQPVRGKTLDILKELVAKGYYMGEIPSSAKHLLKMYFPIKQTHAFGRCVAYLPGKEELAMKAFMDKYKKKAVSFREVGDIARAFGLKKGRKWDLPLIEDKIRA